MRDPHLTYSLRSPIRMRKATCEELECPNWMHGWTQIVPLLQQEFFEAVCAGNVDGLKRKPIEVTAHGALNRAEREYIFNPGNACFEAYTHQLPAQQEAPVFLFRGPGMTYNKRTKDEYKGQFFNAATAYRHASIDDFVEDMAEHLLRVQEDEKRGKRNG